MRKGGSGEGEGGHDARWHKFWWLIKKKEDEDVWLGRESALD